MDLENSFYQEVIEGLNKQGVDFILIGGLAVGFYGYSRYTGDMDLWVEPSEKNLQKLYLTLKSLGYPEEVIDEIKEKRGVINPTPIKLWDDSNTFKVDLMTTTYQKEFSWKECKAESQEIKIGPNTFPVVHINHLIRMKQKSTRLDNSLKDLVDADELIKILKKGKKKP